MKPIKIITDGFKNLLKGLGGDKDPRANRMFVQGIPITQQIAENLYAFNWLAAKVADIPVDDATRKWRNLLISDTEKSEEIEEIYREMDIKNKFSQALKWARVFGGSVIFPVVSGIQGEPIDIDNIKPGSLQNIIVLDRYQLTAHNTNRDITSENFGKPDYYTVNRGSEKIHHSRIIKFDGQKPTIYQAEQNNFWGLSIYTKLWDAIADSQEVSDSIATMIHEANVDVYKIAGFNELVATNEELAKQRLEIAHKMKSAINGIALDGDDSYEKKSNTFTTLPEIDDRFIQKVAGASGIPVTRLLGISPSGQNATGESDMRNYYDYIQSIQENEIRPRLGVLDKIILGNAGYTEDFDYVFNPLKQLSESEQADVDLKNAQRDQIYLDQDVIYPLDALTQLAEKGTYISVDADRVEHENLEEEFGFEEETKTGQPGEEPEGSGESLQEGTIEAGESFGPGSE